MTVDRCADPVVEPRPVVDADTAVADPQPYVGDAVALLLYYSRTVLQPRHRDRVERTRTMAVGGVKGMFDRFRYAAAADAGQEVSD